MFHLFVQWMMALYGEMSFYQSYFISNHQTPFHEAWRYKKSGHLSLDLPITFILGYT